MARASLPRMTVAVTLAALAAAAAVAVLVWSSPPADAANQRITRTFVNDSIVRIPADQLSGGTGGQANPYPSAIRVAGLRRITDLDVTVRFANHTDPDDLDVVLVGPSGRSAILWSDAGGANEMTGVTLTFADDNEAPVFLPDNGQITARTYRTSNYEVGADDWPGVNQNNNRLLSTFYGPRPNGAWRLYVFDDVEQPDTGDRNGTGTFANGWSMKVTGIRR